MNGGAVGAALLALATAACGSAPASQARCLLATAQPLAGDAPELSGMGGLVADSDGSLYVLDSRASELLGLSRDGVVRWRAGREGRGPGEFGNGTGLHWLNGTLAFRDLENHRLSLWTTAGRNVGEIPLMRFHFPSYPGWIGALDTGAVAAAIPPTVTFAGHAPPEEGVLVLARGGAAATDTLLRFAFPPTEMRHMRGGGRIPAFPPLAAFPSFVAGAEGLFAVPDGGRYRIEVFDRRGHHAATLAGPDGAPPVSQRDRRAYLEQHALDAVDPPAFPGRLPAVAGLSLGADGTLLVKTSWREAGAVRWDRWSAKERRFLHSFTLPESVEDAAPVGGRVYTVERDSLDAPVIHAFQLGGHDHCPGPPVGG